MASPQNTQTDPLPCGHRTKHGQRIGCCAGCQHLFSSDTAFSAHRRVGQCRRYVGFERREEQCEAAARRLSQGVLDFGEAAE